MSVISMAPDVGRSPVGISDIEDIAVLSPLQQDMYLHPEPTRHVGQQLWRLPDRINAEALERSWGVLVKRHAILRTVFRQTRQRPVQIVLKRASTSLLIHELGEVPGSAERGTLESILRQEASRPFALASGPLFRLTLLRLSHGGAQLLVTFHRIILDDVSLSTLRQQLAAIYQDTGAEALVCSESDPRSFKAFLSWVARENTSETARFWQNYLSETAGPTPVPLAGRYAGSAARSATDFAIADQVASSLLEYASARQVSVTSVFGAAWALLLSWFAAEPDVLFGVEVSGRPASETAMTEIVGPFANTVPLRLRVEPEQTVSGLIDAFEQQTVNLNYYSYLPLDEIKTKSNLGHSSRLFQSVLRVRSEIDLDGLLPIVDTDAWLTNDDDCCSLTVVGSRPEKLAISAPEGMLDCGATKELAKLYLHVLKNMVSAPETRVGQLELLGAEERELVKQLGQGGVEREEQLWAEQLISIRARAQADAVAVSDGREALSYGELNRRANQLANFLRGQGVGREDRVGILGQRRVGMLVTILGILKSGAGYVPLPASDPRERLLTMARSAGLKWIVADREGMAVAQAVGEQLGCGVMSWEQGCEEGVVGPEQWGRSSAAEPQGVESSGKDLAYVFYTSGSTGTPKGVMVERAGMLNHLRSKIALLGLEEGEVVAQNASYCFDISVWQFMAGLLVGGRVVIYDDGVMMDPAALMAAVRRDEVTILEVVPSYLELLLGLEGVREKLGKLRYLVSTAETLSAALAKRWFACVAGVKLVNAWGSTECSDDVAHAVMAGEWEVGAERVTVGTAIAGSQVYVVDSALQLQPAGATGEIAIGGVCVGRGYLGNAGATAQTFVPDPFGGRAGARLYLSGDLGRWRGDGRLEFLGRRDGQIKVRGHRLEVGEIEAAMSRQGGVRQAVVTLKSGRLVGYWVGEEKAAAELRQQLSTQLPDYMIPEALVRLEQFPRTGSGKLDRRSLPEPDWKGSGASYEAPRTELERQIAQVWQEVLGVEPIGIHDDFFDLGGHSLNTVQVRSRLSQRLKLDVPLKVIFENARLDSLASTLSAIQPSATDETQIIPRLSDREHYPLSHAQRRLWFLHQLDMEDRFYHTADCVLLSGPLNRFAFHEAVNALVRRQATLRTSFTVVNGEPVQHIHDESELPVPFHDLSGWEASKREQQTQMLLAGVSDVPFDLAVPPVRAILIKVSETEHLFLLALHHIISDGWSGTIVARELMQLYSHFSGGQKESLPKLRVRYVDYATWQNDRIERGALKGSQAYWLRRLGGDLPRLQLPVDPSELSNSSQELGEEVIVIDSEVADALKRLAQTRDATGFMARLAAFKAFLSRITGQKDIIVGSTLAGRDHPEVEDLVGLFVNVVAFRTNVEGASSYEEILDQVKHTCLEAYAHQEYPFDLLVRDLAPARTAEQIPIFDTFFAEGPIEQPSSVEGVTFRSVDLGNDTPVVAAGRKLPAAFGMTTHEGADGTLTFRFLFRTGLFASTTARRIAHQFRAFLIDIVNRPNGPLPYVCADPAFEKQVSTKPQADGERELYPLSFNQRDMWFQRQIHGEGGLNNVVARIKIEGKLEVGRWREALQEVVAEQAALRTVFVEQEGMTYQRVLGEVKVEFQRIDLRGKTVAEQAEWMGQVEGERLRAGFDFERGPLFRAELWQTGEEEHEFAFVFNHLILDGVYMAELFEQVGAAYSRMGEGRKREGNRGKLHYGEYAQSQEQRLRGGELEEHEGYWRRQLEPPLPAMDLGFEGEAGPVRSFELGVLERRVEGEVWRGLRGMRKRYRTTVFRTVLAGLEVLLQRLTGEQEVLLGVPFTTRPAQAGAVLGFFGHAVPIRGRVTEGERLEELLQRVNEQLREAEEHVEYPLCEAVRGMKIQRDPHRPLFPVVISQIRPFRYGGGGLQLEMHGRQVQGGVYHLWVTVMEQPDGLTLGFYYNRELLHGEPILRIANCLQHLLADIAAHPDSCVGQLQILAADEEDKVLSEYPAPRKHILPWITRLWRASKSRYGCDRMRSRLFAKKIASRMRSLMRLQTGWPGGCPHKVWDQKIR